MEYIRHWDSPLGGITLASDGEALTGLWFDGQKYFGSTLSVDHQQARPEIFDETVRWLELYFSGRDPGFTPKLRMKGTDFQRSVWQALQTIPFGQTLTYGELAARLEKKTAARAVGSAVGHNPLSLIVPCHRVVGADGSLRGYAGGVERKARLLQMEKGE